MDIRQLPFREARPDLNAHLAYLRQHRHPVSLLLDRVNDQRNLGALFRLADAARLRGIFSYRPADLAKPKTLQRVARSTDRYVPYGELPDLASVAALKKETGAVLIGLEITKNSVPYNRFPAPGECMLIIGNEQNGISAELLELTDHCIHIPMFGVNSSMNVAVATGIAVYGLLEKMGLLQEAV